MVRELPRRFAHQFRAKILQMEIIRWNIYVARHHLESALYKCVSGYSLDVSNFRQDGITVISSSIVERFVTGPHGHLLLAAWFSSSLTSGRHFHAVLNAVTLLAIPAKSSATDFASSLSFSCSSFWSLGEWTRQILSPLSFLPDG